MSLVLTRRVGEAILLRRGERVTRVYVVSIEGNVVRLALDAPRDVEILREELRDRRSPGRLSWVVAALLHLSAWLSGP